MHTMNAAHPQDSFMSPECGDFRGRPGPSIMHRSAVDYNPPPEDVLILGGDDAPELCTVGEAMAWLERDRGSDLPNPHIVLDATDINLLHQQAYELLVKIKDAIGLAAICDWLEWLAYMDRQMVSSAVPEPMSTSETMMALAGAREARHG